MAYLLDTNILLRLAQRQHPMHQIARDSIAILLRRKETLRIVLQNIYERWVVATRPTANNGLGLTQDKVDHLIARAARFCQMLPDLPAIYPEWLKLVRTYAVFGVNAHDARLVAAMNVHGIENLITFNVTDFNRFAGKEIIVLSPFAI